MSLIKEETEVKDKKWLQDSITKVMQDLFSTSKPNYFDFEKANKQMRELVNQLDEPEVLSQEITEEQAYDKIAESFPSTAKEIESVLEKYYSSMLIEFSEEMHKSIMRAFDVETTSKTIEALTGMTLEEIAEEARNGGIVPKQELPVVPTWFDEWWKNVTKGGGNLFRNIERFYDELFSSGTRESYNYISCPDNKKKLLNIIVNELEYETEEEQKYYVSSAKEVTGFWFLSKNNDGKVVVGTNEDYFDYGWDALKLTEQEIKDYDERYFAFAVKIEELEE